MDRCGVFLICLLGFAVVSHLAAAPTNTNNHHVKTRNSRETRRLRALFKRWVMQDGSVSCDIVSGQQCDQFGPSSQCNCLGSVLTCQENNNLVQSMWTCEEDGETYPQ